MRSIVILVIAIALAGCADPTDPTGPGDGAGDPTGGPPNDQNGTAAPDNDTAAPDNGTAPTASLQPSATNGSAPLNVTFAISGSASANLTWALTVNGTGIANGTTLPTNVSYVFPAGVFDVVLTVSDGQANATANATIEAFSAALPEDKTFTGSITGIWLPEAGYVEDAEEHKHTIASAPSTMTVHLSWARTDAAVDLDVFVYDPAGNEVARGTNYNDPVQGDDSEEERFVVDDAEALSRLGEWTFSVISAGSVASDYTLEITFT